MDAMSRSNLVLAKVLDLAMAKGISNWRLVFSDLELGAEYETFFYPCIEWLEAEGLIRVGTYAKTINSQASGAVFNISHTSRGMAVLGQTISIDGADETLADTVKKVSAGKIDYHRIGDAIGGIIGGLFKSLSS